MTKQQQKKVTIERLLEDPRVTKQKKDRIKKLLASRIMRRHELQRMEACEKLMKAFQQKLARGKATWLDCPLPNGKKLGEAERDDCEEAAKTHELWAELAKAEAEACRELQRLLCPNVEREEENA